MRAGGRTPEELETLLEDAFLTGDRAALTALFMEGAVLSAGETPEARGGVEIDRLATSMLDGARTYLAEPRRVLQAGDTALVVAERGLNVVRRGDDGAWRYAIAVLSLDHNPEGGEMTEQETLAPLAVASEEGEARWWFGALAVIKATAADTGGRMTIVEVQEPPGAEAPLHVHFREDEAFWILEGEVTLEVGDAVIEAKAGDYAFGPRDVPHRYTVGPNGCRMLFICTPGGFETLVREMSQPAESRTLPPPSTDPPDFEMVARVAAANGCELLA